MNTSTFHLALPCKSVKNTTTFYTQVIGASVGRFTSHWVDINLFGNQLTFTKSDSFDFKYGNYRFEKELLPTFHFGVILNDESWINLKSRLEKLQLELTLEATFLPDSVGEHQSIIVRDPNGYHIEFKNFAKAGEVFAA